MLLGFTCYVRDVCVGQRREVLHAPDVLIFFNVTAGTLVTISLVQTTYVRTYTRIHTDVCINKYITYTYVRIYYIYSCLYIYYVYVRTQVLSTLNSAASRVHLEVLFGTVRFGLIVLGQLEVETCMLTLGCGVHYIFIVLGFRLC